MIGSSVLHQFISRVSVSHLALCLPAQSPCARGTQKRGPLLSFLSASLIILCCQPVFSDTIVLDDFSTGINGTVTFSQVATPGTGPTGSTSIPNTVRFRKNTRATWTDSRSAPASMLWNSRSANFSRIDTGAVNATTSVAINASAPSALDIVNPEEASAVTSVLTYRNSGAATAVDLSSMATFNIDVFAIDQDVSTTLTLHDNNGNTGSGTFSLSTATLGRQSLSLASIFSSINSSQVVRADLTFTVHVGGDIKLTSLYFAPVPEPSVIFFATITLAALAIRRRRFVWNACSRQVTSADGRI